MNNGFFFKEYTAQSAPNNKRGSRTKKIIIKELPPVLKIQVPATPKKKEIKKQFHLDTPQVEMDIECYSNYFLVKFRKHDGTYIEFEMIDEMDIKLDRSGIYRMIDKYEIVSFNGNHYDMLILNYALTHEDCTNKDLKKASNEIIKNEMRSYKFEEKYNLSPIEDLNHIDIKPLCPANASLKLCGARLHCTRLQDLPYSEDSKLNEEQMDNIDEYCENDLDVTALLKKKLVEEIELRRAISKKYDIDVMSKSDAQIAEEIIKAELLSIKGRKVKKPKELHTVQFYYQIPDFVQFKNPKLNEVLDILKHNQFTARPVASGIKMPEQLDDLEIKIGQSTYRMGIGGLHSTEKTAFHLADDEYDLWDWDVTSFYPSIILQCGLYPKSMGEQFLDIFEEIVQERIAAKVADDKVKAASMKITTNGTFGKLGSPYSILYAPELMIQVTITGQLSLLMLIDTLEYHGFEVVSGNTDGIVVKCKRDRKEAMRAIIKRWEKRTGFNMESTNYAGLYSRDVNNYIAIKYDGEVKLKGCFGYVDLHHKNPEYDVCTDALVEYLKYGTSIRSTIEACKDITKFITVRQVNGGAIKYHDTSIPEHKSKEELIEMAGFEHYYNNTWIKPGKEGSSSISLDEAYKIAKHEVMICKKTVYLGRVVRWYYSTAETGFIAYKTNGNKVPSSDGAKPIMILPKTFPNDINYDWYVNKCKDLFY